MAEIKITARPEAADLQPAMRTFPAGSRELRDPTLSGPVPLEPFNAQKEFGEQKTELTLKGNPKVGTVINLGQIHYAFGMDQVTLQHTGKYQEAMPRYLCKLKPEPLWLIELQKITKKDPELKESATQRLVMNVRERETAAVISKWLANHPCTSIVFIYGAAHAFGTEDSKSPNLPLRRSRKVDSKQKQAPLAP